MAKLQNPDEILAGVSLPGQTVEPTVADLQKQLLELQLHRLSKQDAEEAEQERMHMQARLEAAKALEKARKEQEAIQSVCPHLKPNGQPAIGGQRDHQHNYIFICAYCQKLFDQHSLPAHLRIDGQKIGGPE